jgi:hypothetical protein
LPLAARVEQPISVADVHLGLISTGQKYEKKLIVKGKQPFEIVGISSSNPRLSFTPDSGLKTLHIISYKFEPANEGLVADQIVIKTNNATQPLIKIDFAAQVVEQTIAGGDQE